METGMSVNTEFEAGMPVDAYIREQFALPQADVRTYSPLTLAFIGDGAFELIIRSAVVGRANAQADKLHKKKSSIVNAKTQSRMIEALLADNFLTEEEVHAYHRGRNAKSPTTAKNASVADYRKATGFEALIGYLYVGGNFARCIEISKRGMELLKIEL